MTAGRRVLAERLRGRRARCRPRCRPFCRLRCRPRRRLRCRPSCRPGALGDAASDEGNAQVEFLGVAVLLLVPLVYLVLVVGRIEAASFAVEGAAREAARVAAEADTPDEATQRAVAVVGVALRDQGFDDDPADALRIACSSRPCLAPGSTVTARVEVDVDLPFVPSFVRRVVPLDVPVTAERVVALDEYRAGP